MAKKALEDMTKLELLEYAKRARYMLGKMHLEKEQDQAKILELESTVQELRDLVEKHQQQGGR